MSNWDANAQRWVQSPSSSGGGPGVPPPDDGSQRLLIVAIVTLLLCAAAGTGIWMLAHHQGGGSPRQEAPLLTPSDMATDTWTATPAFPETDEPSPTDWPSPEATPSADDGPDATVTSYFDAINEGDYTTAWNLGGKNLDNSYSAFVSGFSETQRDEVTIVSVQGDTVSVDLVSFQTDGTQRSFTGTYTVRDGVITEADMRRTS
ncbi:hypothetical protein [Streptomyces sp. S465]|uniref:hypothetical protein n=1 Tax=Streptomyces sp. S465 TaxID=2979468 RepID=UPI0022A8A31C|nr:hypothetical protein [Streptomyces sp. S465]WAP60236.1 hypothetical protein N6H00_37670 [Streptomyces sp. S465]